MARYTGADCKRCRREKMKLFLKGSKCESPKCPIEIRPYPPGEHGRGRTKDSEYLLQMQEKQKAKYEPRFDHWVTASDLATTPQERKAAQKQVVRYYRKLYQKGYFRDSYNSSDLVWLFELDWWEDIPRLLDKQQRLESL